MIVMDNETCMVDVARYFLKFVCEESCGKCIPCREGTKRMSDIMERICAGDGQEGDIETLERMGKAIAASSLCGLGQTAPNPTLSTIRYFRDEYEAHIRDKRCPAGVCKALIDYRIDEKACTGCGACARNCPVTAITGEKKKTHVLDQDKCVKCGACRESCKFNAVVIEKAHEHAAV
jgi:ferredoxin